MSVLIDTLNNTYPGHSFEVKDSVAFYLNKETHDITKTYERVLVIDNIYFSVYFDSVTEDLMNQYLVIDPVGKEINGVIQAVGTILSELSA